MSPEMEPVTAAGDEVAADPAPVMTTARHDTAAADGGRQRDESFVVRVLLNEDHSTRSTAIRHIRTGAERRWPGWSPEALTGFVAATCSNPPARPEPAPPAPAEAPAADAPAQPVRRMPASSARLSVEHPVLRAAEPFTATFTLDVAGAAAGLAQLGYRALIAAKPLAGGPDRVIAKAAGLLATGSPVIRIEAEGLTPGAYRLDGAVTLREPGTDRPVDVAAPAESLTVRFIG